MTIALLPGQQIINGPTGPVSNFLFGTNAPPDYGNTNTIRWDKQKQALIKQAGFTLMRTALNDIINGADQQFSDAMLDQTYQMCVNSGCAMLGIIPLKLPLSYAQHAVTYLGSRCNLYEFGNEPDLGGFSWQQYLSLWTQWVPTLRAINPNAKFIGPVLGVFANVQGYLVPWLQGCKNNGNSAVLPDAISYHIYPCTGDSSSSSCSTKPTHVSNNAASMDSIIRGILGYSLQQWMTEWNIDANGPPQPYTLDSTFNNTWTTQCVDAMVTEYGNNFLAACQFDASSGAGGSENGINGCLDMIDISSDKPRSQLNTMANRIAYYLNGSGGVSGGSGSLTASPTSLTFNAVVGGANPASQTVTLNNGTGASLSYLTGSESNFVSASPASGTIANGATATSAVSVNISGLSAGTYTAALLYGYGSSGQNATVNITIVVSASGGGGGTPALSVSPSSLSLSTAASLQGSVTLTGGGVSESWTSSISYSSGSGSGWLSASPASGTLTTNGTQAIMLTASPTGLAQGTYTATVTFATGSVQPVSVSVTLTVTANTSSGGSLSVYLANAASTTLSTADQLYTIANAGTPSNTRSYSRVGTATGYGEVTSQGTTGAWAASGSIGSPTGKGFFLDASTLDSQQISAGNWSGFIRINCAQNGDANPNAGTVTADIIVRAYKYSSGTYTQIVSMTLAAQSVTYNFTTFTLPSTAGSATTFATGDRLYIDIWLHVTTNTNGSSVQDIRLNRLSTDTTGKTGDASNAAVVTPGYVNTVPLLSVSPAALNFSGVTGGSNPANQSITLTNVGYGSGSYSTSISYGSGSGWLAVSPTSGTLAVNASATQTVSVNISGLSAGTYTATIVSISGGSQVTTTVTLTITGSTTKPFAVYLANAHSATVSTANQLYSKAAASTPSTQWVYTRISTHTGYGEVYSQGTLGAWASAGSLGNPSGNGFFLDATTLDGQQLAAGNYSALIRLNCAQGEDTGLIEAGSITADIIVRLYKYSAATYTQITSMTLAGQTIPSTFTTFSLSTSSPTSSATTFATGDKLYVDLWLNITSNTNGMTNQDVRLNRESTDTSGMTGDSGNAAIVTPGITVASSTAATLSVSPTSLTYTGTQGGTNPNLQAMTLAHTGATAQGWTSSITFSDSHNWLTLSSTQGTLPASGTQTVNGIVSLAGLPAGTYTATIVYQLAGSNSVSVNVSLTVSAPSSTLSISPTSVSITATTGGTNPTNTTLALSSSVAGTWQASVLFVNNANWMSLSALSGTFTGSGTQSLTLAYTTQALAAGTYSALITFTMPGAQSVTLAVTLTMQANSASNPTVTVAGTPLAVRVDTLQVLLMIDETSTANLTVVDSAGTASIPQNASILVNDPLQGVLFEGFIGTVESTLLYPQTTKMHVLSCTDQRYLAMKRYPTSDYDNELAGDIVIDLIENYLAAEGVQATYAVDRDNDNASFQQGVLTRTTTINGALELALAGGTLTYTDDYDFGTLTNVAPNTQTGALQLLSNQSVKITGTSSQGVSSAAIGQTGNNYCYWEIWTGAVTIASGDTLSYDVWISSTSPQITSGVDGICSDGTTIRDYSNQALKDQNSLAAHPNTDLSGYANDQWYTRQISLSALAGKTLATVSVALEGNNTGNYTSYFRNIQLVNGGTQKQSFFYNSLQTSEQLGNIGYANTSIGVVTTYQKSGMRISPYTPVSSVGIVQNSLISWTTDAVQPANTSLIVEASIDGGATWQACTNNTALPNLFAGANAPLQGVSLRERFALTGPSPELSPSLYPVNFTINPSYANAKTDVLHTETSAIDFSKGTNTNLLLSNGSMTVNGAWRSWDDGNISGQTIYGTGTPTQQIIGKQCSVAVTGNGNEGRSRLDFAGQWANFTAEVDIYVNTHGNYSFVYRTTGWQNNNNCHAYNVDLTQTQIILGRGTNSSTGTGTFTSIATATLDLTKGTWFRLKVVANGSSHKIYVNDVLYINATDATYTGAGYFGLRFYNSDPANTTYSAFFDNFGVVASYSGTHVTAPIDLSAIAVVGSSVAYWQADIPTDDSVVVSVSYDNGVTWTACTNGQPIPGLAAGATNNHASMLIQVILNVTNASATPLQGVDGNIYFTAVLHGFTVWVTSQLNARGARVSPPLALSQVGWCGSTSVSWDADTPAGTALGVDVSTNGGGSWTDVSASNGGAIPGINEQPDPSLDTFSTNSTANYTSTSYSSGTTATWSYDSVNSRLTASGGTNALYLWNQGGFVNGTVEGIVSQADATGLVARYTDATHFYLAVVSDASSATNPNTVKLYSMVAGTLTLLGTASVSFPRGTCHVLKLSCVLTQIAVLFDGVQVLVVNDGSVSGVTTLPTGVSVGFAAVSGTAYWYQLRSQPLGDNLTGVQVLTRLRLSSTDPTQTPKVKKLTVSVRNPDIESGALIPSTNYAYQTKIDQVLDDLKNKSNYWCGIANARLFFQNRNGVAAPWALSSNSGDLLDATPPVLRKRDTLYRNRQYIRNALAPASSTTQEKRAGDGRTQSWKMTSLIATPSSSVPAPTITRNGNVASVGITGIDTGRDFYYTPGGDTFYQASSELPPQAASGNTPAETLVFTYTPLSKVTVMAEDKNQQAALAQVDGSTGIVEESEDANGLYIGAATQLAQARIAQYAILGREWDFSTLRGGLKPGQLLALFVPEFGLNNITPLITQVKINYLVNRTQYDVTCVESYNPRSWVSYFTAP